MAPIADIGGVECASVGSMPSAPKNVIRLLPSAASDIEPMFARTTRTFGRHFHDQFGVGVVLSGAQRSASGRGPVEAVRGDVITVNPGEVHDGAPIGGQVRTWRCFTSIQSASARSPSI